MPTWTNAIITAGLLLLLISNSSVAVQIDSNDAGSQRILPLPDGQLSNAQTQMQLLQKLRSLVTGTPDEPQAEASSSNSREAKDEQLEQLLNALKKLRDQLPPGIKPPDLDSIPKDQLEEAISNPAVQQQMKQMLEQFSRDGQLPKAGLNSDEPSQHSLRAFQDLLQRYRNSQQGNHQESADGFSESRDGTLPEIRPGARSQHPESLERSPEQDASSRILRRSDRLKPVEPFEAP
ncbi:MAG: hypothetical protein KDB01_12360, partial [Planctomycetaceae bacterium]|nr:hypothetical protein [Planctomycetaceae bacterium]